MKHEYIVTTNMGLCKMKSRKPLDLVSAQKILENANNPAKVLLVRELGFFEKVRISYLFSEFYMDKHMF